MLEPMPGGRLASERPRYRPIQSPIAQAVQKVEEQAFIRFPKVRPCKFYDASTSKLCIKEMTMPIFPGVSCAELEIIHSIRFDVDRSILALRDDQLNAIIEEGKMLLRRIDPVVVAIEGEVMGTVSVS